MPGTPSIQAMIYLILFSSREEICNWVPSLMFRHSGLLLRPRTAPISVETKALHR